MAELKKKMDTLTKLVKFSMTLHGMDRFWMFGQFFSKLVGSIAARQMGADNMLTKRMSEIEQNLNWARYAGRFNGMLLALDLWRASCKEEDPLRSSLMKLDALVLLMLNPSQHLCWLAAYCPGIVPDRKRLGRASLTVLLGHLGLYLTLNGMKYRKLAAQEAEEAASKGADAPEVAAKRAARNELVLKMVSSVCDSIIVFNGTHIVEKVRVPNMVVAILGLVSCASSTYVAWGHTH
jgi:hypothetical protein